MKRVSLADIEIIEHLSLCFRNGIIPKDEAFVDEADLSLRIRFDTGRNDGTKLVVIYPKGCWRWRPSCVN